MDRENFSTKENQWLNYIEEYIANIFKYSKDPNNNSDLLADGFDIHTKQPVCWVYEDNRQAPISNFASQQNFLRLLVAMTNITGNSIYQEKAKKMTDSFITHFTDPKSHLFYWGGHRFINLKTLETEGPANKSQVHELKNHLPFYDLLYQTNPEATLNYIKAVWNAHINDWETLNLSRHGDYEKPFVSNGFSHKQHDVVTPNCWPNLPQTTGLTFINAGTDLIYAAYQFAKFTQDQNAYKWAKHLYRQYVLARCPETGMPVYQYSSPLQRQPDPKDDNQTESWFGDRAKRQFGPEFGDIAIEANVLFRDMSPMDMWPLLMDNPLAIMMAMREQPDQEVIQWTIDGLKNYYLRAYDSNTHTLRPMWGNGIDMTGYVFKRNGYYGPKGTVLHPIEFRPDYLFPLVVAWKLTQDIELEKLIMTMLKNMELALFSGTFFQLDSINLTHNFSSPNLIFALIELNEIITSEKLSLLIESIADNLFQQHTNNGFFADSTKHRFVRIDNIYPLALLAVIAARQGSYLSLPIPLSKGGYVHGEYLINGKLQTIYDVNYIYQQLVN